MTDAKAIREVRIWICDDEECSCGGSTAIYSYQDLIDCGTPICEGGLDMVQLSGFGHDAESDTIDIELANYEADRDDQEE